MDEHLVTIIVAAITFLLGPLAVAFVTRKANANPKEIEIGLDDGTADELARSNRALGERLHGETQGLVRKVERDMHERFDRTDRCIRQLGDEVRDFMRPSKFRSIVEDFKDKDDEV